MQSLKKLFLDAPEGQLDPAVKPSIEAWSDPPTALQLLRTLDEVVHGGAGSSFVVNTLNMLLGGRLKIEGQSYEQLVSQADWRDTSK